jgi:hypothetical protein
LDDRGNRWNWRKRTGERKPHRQQVRSPEPG